MVLFTVMRVMSKLSIICALCHLKEYMLNLGCSYGNGYGNAYDMGHNGEEAYYDANDDQV